MYRNIENEIKRKEVLVLKEKGNNLLRQKKFKEA